MAAVEVRRYQTAAGKVPLTQWLDGLKDEQHRARIVARLDRLQVGLFGDWKSAGGDVCELRLDFGPGFRVYYAQDGATLVLLLCGGEKSSQTSDIKKAHEYWKDYKARRAPQPKPAVQGGKPSAKRKANRRLR
jgi:putative addiction module killer protein